MNPVSPYILATALTSGLITGNGSSVDTPSDNVAINYINYDHPKLKAAGVLPYAMVGNEPYLLLGKESEGEACANRWKGFGGKKETGESLFENALREFIEESKASVQDYPSPYQIDGHPKDGVLATTHLNCRYYQLMLPVDYDATLPERFQETVALSRFEKEKDELQWIKLQNVVDAVRSARVLSLVQNCPPSKIEKPIIMNVDGENLVLSPDFVETLMIQLCNPEDGIHKLLSGDPLLATSFSSDEAPNFYENGPFSLNTGNAGKLKEFQQYFGESGWQLEMTKVDLDEINAEPELVAMHKASQMADRVLVEDTSIDVEGADVGINIKYLINNLSEYVGSQASWTVFLSFKDHGHVYTFKGEVKGTIVEPRGNDGFGFDPYFLPDGAEETLAENKPTQYNARAAAIHSLLNGKIHGHGPAITHWDGPWQQNSA
jgi:XTP/dITP diphosphohydrolase